MAASLPPSNGKTLLITGISGYIASTLGSMVLAKGYNLRGTSRSLQSVDALLKGAYKDYASRVTIYEVPNMTVPGAFDEAVAGVHGIFHTASPVDFTITTYEGMIFPAVHGSTTLLNSALEKAGPQLEAVVVTSSVAAVADLPTAAPGQVYTEADFAHSTLDLAQKNWKAGVSSPPGLLYTASKTAAERAVWEFRDAKKPFFSVSTVNPGVVIGPPVQLPATPAKLNATLQPIWALLSGASMPGAIGTASFVDVRDIGTMHLYAFEHAAAVNGNRYIGVSGYGPPQAAADILREHYTDRLDVIPVGTPGAGYEGYKDGKVQSVGWAEGSIRVSGARAKKEMGIRFRSFQESVLETAKAMEAYL